MSRASAAAYYERHKHDPDWLERYRASKREYAQQRRGATVASSHLRCDCGATFPLDTTALTRHTITEHGRKPARHERTPRRT